MNSEKTILKQIVKYLGRLRDEGEPLWWFKVHGGPMMPAGIPDLIICYYGRFVGIEVKRPGENRTKLQLHVANLIWDAMGVAAVARSVEDVSALLADVRPSEGQPTPRPATRSDNREAGQPMGSTNGGCE